DGARAACRLWAPPPGRGARPRGGRRPVRRGRPGRPRAGSPLMWGVCGVVSCGAPPDLELLRRMMGRLGHRGPDGNGYYRDRRAALGHTRLAIIDTSGGAQPLCNEDGTVWGTFNGEIFN